MVGGRILKGIALVMTLAVLMSLINGVRLLYVFPILIIALVIGIAGYAKNLPGG